MSSLEREKLFMKTTHVLFRILAWFSLFSQGVAHANSLINCDKINESGPKTSVAFDGAQLIVKESGKVIPGFRFTGCESSHDGTQYCGYTSAVYTDEQNSNLKWRTSLNLISRNNIVELQYSDSFKLGLFGSWMPTESLRGFISDGNP